MRRRSAKCSTARNALAATIVEWTTQRKPANSTHWSTRTLAAELADQFFHGQSRVAGQRT